MSLLFADVLFWFRLVFFITGICNITSLTAKQLSCRPPDSEPVAKGADGRPRIGSIPEVRVVIADRQNVSIGLLSYEAPSSAFIFSTEVIIGISVGCGILLLLVIGFFIMYRRKATESHRVLKSMQEQIDVLELQVASECKEAFAELQTDITDWTEALNTGGIPFRDYRWYGSFINSFTSSIDWLIYRLINRNTIDWLIDWSIDPLFDWLIDWLFGPLIDWLIHWLIDWLVSAGMWQRCCSRTPSPIPLWREQWKWIPRGSKISTRVSSRSRTYCGRRRFCWLSSGPWSRIGTLVCETASTSHPCWWRCYKVTWCIARRFSRLCWRIWLRSASTGRVTRTWSCWCGGTSRWPRRCCRPGWRFYFILSSR